MSKAKLSGECLKLMRNAYKESKKDLFSLDYFAEALPEASREELTDALNALQELGIVSIFYADDEAYMTTYDPDGVSKLIAKKGASAVKDVIGWVIGLL